MENLMRTKLFKPSIPAESIQRLHLIERLNANLSRKLSIIVAPAGYGKTTLVTSWLNQLPKQEQPPQQLWLSLDKSDDDVHRFFTYFVAALGELDPRFLENRDLYLQDYDDALPISALITNLVNQFVTYAKSIIFVLDDYHEIKDPRIHDAVSSFLEHLPPNFHLVITTRSQPPLQLPLLRVRRQMVEIDMDDLRFSRDESTHFLNDNMQLNLTADDVQQLDSVTEGWVASLQLAALTLQNKNNPSELIQNFKGDHRYIVDYLAAEVLSSQTPEIQNFLLQTSILEKFNATLCDAVLEREDSQQLLNMLDQSRLFVIPLDSARQWYRYHHLFADFLQAEAHRNLQGALSSTHERASRWLSENGFLVEGIQHAVRSGNQQLVAELMAENAWTLLALQGEVGQLRRWLENLPDHLIKKSPYLLVITAWLELGRTLDEDNYIDDLLEEASALIDSTAYSSSEVADLKTQIALTRTNRERLRGNLLKAIEYCEHALSFAPDVANPVLKVGVPGTLATVYYLAGNIPQFLKYNPVQLDSIVQAASITHARFTFLSYLIDAFRLNGRLSKAENIFQDLTSHLQGPQSRGKAMVAISWAELLRERHQFDQALDYLLPAFELLKLNRSMAMIVQTGAITLARIYQAQGKGQQALTLLSDIQKAFQDDTTYFPSARLAATEARIQLQRGNLLAAKNWAERTGLTAKDEPSFLLEIDHLVFARILIADDDAESALTLLDTIHTEVEANCRFARLIEVFMLQSLAHQALDHRKEAVALLTKAVDLAQHEGYFQTFVEEGLKVVPLLKEVARQGVGVAFIKQLLPMFEEAARPKTAVSRNTAVQPNSEDIETSELSLSLNPLTERELTTLRYLARELTVPQIAEQMVVAPSTIRTYLKRIYNKLDVHNRDEAVLRAQALALLD